MAAGIHKIKPRSHIFKNFKNPNGKISDLWVKIHFAQKHFPGE